MANKNRKDRCVYCLRFRNGITDDHVIPKSWYPDTTPNNMEKWQVPACPECNSKYSKVEGELLQLMGLCLEPGDYASLGIAEKAVRAFMPSVARDDKDKQVRAKQLHFLMKSIIPYEQIPSESVFPGFGPHPHGTPDEQVGIPVPERSLKVLGEKLVRGIMYKQFNTYIDDAYEIGIWFAHEKEAQLLIQGIKLHGKEYIRGPGIRVALASTIDDPKSGAFDIEIWRKFRMYATVLPVQRVNPVSK